MSRSLFELLQELGASNAAKVTISAFAAAAGSHLPSVQQANDRRVQAMRRGDGVATSGATSLSVDVNEVAALIASGAIDTR